MPSTSSKPWYIPPRGLVLLAVALVAWGVLVAFSARAYPAPPKPKPPEPPADSWADQNWWRVYNPKTKRIERVPAPKPSAFITERCKLLYPQPRRVNA